MKYKFKEKPCMSGKKWLDEQPDAKTAWAKCERGDWMWWALMHSEYSSPSPALSISYVRWCKSRAKIHSYIIDDSDLARAIDAATAAAIYVIDAAYLAAFSTDTDGDTAEIRERKLQARWIRKHCTWKG